MDYMLKWQVWFLEVRRVEVEQQTEHRVLFEACGVLRLFQPQQYHPLCWVSVGRRETLADPFKFSHLLGVHKTCIVIVIIHVVQISVRRGKGGVLEASFGVTGLYWKHSLKYCQLQAWNQRNRQKSTISVSEIGILETGKTWRRNIKCILIIIQPGCWH